jgi:hypothetical protein
MPRQELCALCAVGLAAISAARPALAESSEARDRIEVLEEQLAALQAELRALKR